MLRDHHVCLPLSREAIPSFLSCIRRRNYRLTIIIHDPHTFPGNKFVNLGTQTCMGQQQHSVISQQILKKICSVGRCCGVWVSRFWWCGVLDVFIFPYPFWYEVSSLGPEGSFLNKWISAKGMFLFIYLHWLSRFGFRNVINMFLKIYFHF